MIVYNVTNKVHPEVEGEWVRWQKEEHIPDIMSSGMFTEYKIYRLLDQDETDGVTYIIQYFAPDIEHYQQYVESFAPPLRKKAMDRWGNKFIAFRTIMQVVN
jgi:hypothetical protein